MIIALAALVLVPMVRCCCLRALVRSVARGARAQASSLGLNKVGRQQPMPSNVEGLARGAITRVALTGSSLQCCLLVRAVAATAGGAAVARSFQLPGGSIARASLATGAAGGAAGPAMRRHWSAARAVGEMVLIRMPARVCWLQGMQGGGHGFVPVPGSGPCWVFPFGLGRAAGVWGEAQCGAIDW